MSLVPESIDCDHFFDGLSLVWINIEVRSNLFLAVEILKQGCSYVNALFDFL